jgi:hypothetical protein
MFISPDEITDRHWKMHILGRGEGIAPEFVLEARDDDSEAQGIQPRLQQDEIIVETIELFVLLCCDLFEL